MLKDWNYRTHTTDLLNLDENKFGLQEEFSMKEKGSPTYSNPKYARTGRNEESSRTSSWWSLSAKITKKIMWQYKKLTSQLQEMQDQMNSMIDSGEFQEVESNYSGRLSYVSSQPAMIPSSPFHAEPRQTLASWHREYNLYHRKTFLVINFLRLIQPEIMLKEFTLTTSKRERLSSPWSRKDEDQSHEWRRTKSRPQFQCRHLRKARWLRVLQYRWNYHRTTWSDSKDNKYRNCNSTNSLIHNRFSCGKFDSKIKWLPVLILQDFPNFEMLDAKINKIGSALNKIIQNTQFKKKASLESRKSRKRIAFYEEDRSPSWATTTFEWLALMIQY